MTVAVSTTQETAAPTVETWAIDPSHTQVGFAVKHLMISTVKGRFPEVSGTVVLDPGHTTPELEVTISVASVTTGDERRDAHLRSPDFFHVEGHPTITFRSRRFDGKVDSRFTVQGDLTIRGITRSVYLAVTNEGRITDPWGKERMGFTATAKINRREFGLEWNAALEAGGVVVGDDVRITIEAELVRQS